MPVLLKKEIIVIIFENGGGKISYLDEESIFYDLLHKNENEINIDHNNMKRLKSELQSYIYLQVKELNIINTENTNIANINTMLVYENPISFNESEIPRSLLPWFIVTDIEHASNIIFKKKNLNFNLTNVEILNIINTIGIKEVLSEKHQRVMNSNPEKLLKLSQMG